MEKTLDQLWDETVYVQTLESGDEAYVIERADFMKAVQEYASTERNGAIQERSEAEEDVWARAIRNRAIQECIDCFNGMFLVPPSDTVEVAKQMKESYYKMLKLKT